MKTKIKGLQFGNTMMGDQEVANASFQNVKILGTLTAKNCEYETLVVLGDATLHDCRVNDLLINGELKAIKGVFQDIRVNGSLSMEHSTCHDINVLGELKGTGISCHILSYGIQKTNIKLLGSANKVPQIQGETLYNNLNISLDGSQRFQSIINSHKMSCHGELMCKQFFQFHTCDLQELNSDFCYIDPTHSSTIKELHGTLIIIDRSFDEAWLKDVVINQERSTFVRKHGLGKTKIGVIEADEVMVDDASVDIIRAHRVLVGPHAQVNNIEYQESCQIHEHATVKQCKQVA